MSRYRIRMVEPALIKSGVDRLVVGAVVRALAPHVPAARRRWLIQRANLPTRIITSVGGPRWWESAEARADRAFAPALAAYQCTAGDSIEQRREAR